MDSRISDLSRYRMEKSREDLLSAKLLLDNNCITQSINRSYYIIFHAVRSLLAYDFFNSSREQALLQYSNAVKFVDMINRYIQENCPENRA